MRFPPPEPRIPLSFTGTEEIPPEVEARFWSRVDKTGDCWFWKRGKTGTGYGAFRFDRRAYPAHRIAFRLARGPIPLGLVLDHICRNRACVNPAHLEPVSLVENMQRDSPYTSRDSCKYGHPYTPENTFRQRSRPRTRQCRACRRAWGRGLHPSDAQPLRGVYVLTPNDVAEIRRRFAAGASRRSLELAYECSSTAIRHIVLGQPTKAGRS